MKNTSESTAETPEQIAEHISRLMAEAEALLAGPIVDADRGGGRWQELRTRLGALQDKAVVAYGDARKKIVAGAKFTDTTIRSHPYESLAVALGLGLLLGALLRRTDNT